MSLASGSVLCFERKLGGCRDAVFDRSVDRTVVREYSVHPLRRLLLGTRGFEAEADMDSADHQDLTFQFDLPHHLGGEPFVRCRDLTRLQRASKGPGQSAAGGRNQVIQRGGMGLVGVRRYLVVLGHGSVNAEYDWLGFGG